MKGFLKFMSGVFSFALIAGMLFLRLSNPELTETQLFLKMVTLGHYEAKDNK